MAIVLKKFMLQVLIKVYTWCNMNILKKLSHVLPKENKLLYQCYFIQDPIETSIGYKSETIDDDIHASTDGTTT
jgi:hypothetical protein